MKKILVLSTGIACAISLSAQKQAPLEIHNANGSFYKECYSVRATKPLRDIIAEQKAKGLDKLTHYDHPGKDGDAMKKYAKKAHHPGMANPPHDAALQSEMGHETTSAMANFEGQPGYGGYPLDPNGMIGSNYYVQTINSSFAAWDRTGTPYINQTELDYLFGSDGVTQSPFMIRWLTAGLFQNLKGT
jgi:hypothetical protein